jgi:hypothetical protein
MKGKDLVTCENELVRMSRLPSQTACARDSFLGQFSTSQSTASTPVNTFWKVVLWYLRSLTLMPFWNRWASASSYRSAQMQKMMAMAEC